MNRRTFLAAAAAGALAPRVSFAAARTDRRLVLIVLRGGLDGLAAAPPIGDPALASLRAPIPGVVPLDATFALHPGLAPLAERWAARELVLVHAAAVPYRDRSHFDAQNVLENGTDQPFGAPSGWLNRALAARGDGTGLALGAGLPWVLRGPSDTSSIDADHLPRADPALLAAVRTVTGADPLFGPALDRGLATAGSFRDLPAEWTGAERLGRVLAPPDGPAVAVIDHGGFDTHTAQERTLAARLPEVAETIDGLRRGLGEAWSRTVVIAATEFGRTAADNGTDGTDHGVGGAAFVVGGAVAGGRVVADWPGLGPNELLDGRDLRPTTDLRAVFKGVLADHLEVPRAALDRDVFPGSTGVAPIADLVRS